MQAWSLGHLTWMVTSPTCGPGGRTTDTTLNVQETLISVTCLLKHLHKLQLT